MTPLSKESVQAGYRDHLILPNLRHLHLGSMDSCSSAEAISGEGLSSLIASRKSVNRGLSTLKVMFAAMGDLQASSSEPATLTEDIPFDKKRCACIRSVKLIVPIKMENALESWIKAEVEFHSVQTAG